MLHSVGNQLHLLADIRLHPDRLYGANALAYQTRLREKKKYLLHWLLKEQKMRLQKIGEGGK